MGVVTDIFIRVLWTLFNISLVVIIAYIVINAYRTYVKKAALQARHNELLIKKLDELIALNKTIVDHLSAK